MLKPLLAVAVLLLMSSSTLAETWYLRVDLIGSGVAADQFRLAMKTGQKYDGLWSEHIYKWERISFESENDCRMGKKVIYNELIKARVTQRFRFRCYWVQESSGPTATVTPDRPGEQHDAEINKFSKPSRTTSKLRSLVVETQSRLKELGYDPGPVDGILGERTLSAVKQFQKSQGLTETGKVTEALVKTLEAAAVRSPPHRRLTEQRLIAMIQKQIAPCWNIPRGTTISGTSDIKVWVQIGLNADGSLRGVPKVLDAARMRSDRSFRAVAESAVRAFLNPRCSPLKLPYDQYDIWRNTTLNFEASDVRRTAQ